MKIRYVFIILILCLLFVWGCFVGGYKAIELFDNKASVKQLDLYKLKDDEKIQDKFIINNREYVITQYKEKNKPYTQHNILLKFEDKYYSLEEIKECDMNSYLKDNDLYVHCIGKNGNISKYTFIDINVEISDLDLNYISTPNISQEHIKIDMVGKNNIYLSSIKVNDEIAEGERVKCSLENNTCSYMK